MKADSRKGCRHSRNFRRRTAAAVMCVLILLTVLEPSVQAFDAPGARSTVTFAFENKQDMPVSDVNILLKDAWGNEISASSSEENKVTFEGLSMESSYDYIIDVGENKYKIPEEGTIEVADRNMEIPVTLYAEDPGCSMESEKIKASFGDQVKLEVKYTGNEPVYYQWYFGEERLEGETSAVLTLDSVTHREEGAYYCTVETDLSDSVKLSAVLSVSTEEIIYGKVTPEIGKDYSVSEPDRNTGWYNNSNQLIITPVSDRGFDQIWDGTAWTDQVIVREDSAEGLFNIVLRNSMTEEEANPVPLEYKLDSSDPTDIGVSAPTAEKFDRGTSTYEIEFIAVDETSGISSITWYDTDNKSHVVEQDRSGRFIEKLTSEEWKSIRRIEATDAAGNIGENTNTGNRFIEISYPKADRIRDKTGAEISSEQCDADSTYYYQSTLVTVSLAASDDAVSAGAFVLYKNSVKQPVSLEYDSETGLYTSTVQLDLEEAYTISIQAEGYTIFSSEYTGAVFSNTYASARHILDTKGPVISVAYAPDQLSGDENVTGYNQVRTATVTVIESNFNPADLEFTYFSATDVTGDALKDEERLKEEMTKALKEADWKADNGTYTAKNVLVFDTDANYDFSLKCTDLAGNSGSYEENEPFIIDQTAPADLKIVYETNPIDTILEILSFGFYNPSVTVTLSASDDISGIAYFSWTYEQEDGTSTTVNVDYETGTINSTDDNFLYQYGGKKAAASLVLTGNEVKQYRGSIHFTVTDKVGNTSEVHDSNGDVKQADGSVIQTQDGYVVVVDTIAPVRTVRYPEPQQIRDQKTMELYTGDKAEYANKENTDSILYYDHTCENGIQVEVTITEANFYAQDVKVLVNDSEYTIEDWSNEGDDWTGHIKLSEDGFYTIKITYTDRSGNEMTAYQSEQIVLDRTPPVIEKYEFVPDAADGMSETSEFIEFLEYGYYFKTDFEVVITASDTISGMDRIGYRLVPYENGVKQDELTGTVPVTDGTVRLSVPSGFKGQIYAEGFDNAGNSSSEVTPRAFVIDDSAPAIELLDENSTSYADAEGNALYVSDISITVSITDQVSGIREIIYSHTSEKSKADKKITLNNTGYRTGDQLDDGWVVEETDENLVTKVSRTFVYDSDDNDIVLSVSATDRAGNEAETVSSRCFTIDKTEPVIDVTFRDDDDSDPYYNADRIADVTVTERNFDAGLIKAVIQNEIGDVPDVTFSKLSKDEYTAVIVFDEGDYTFRMEGTDLGGHQADVRYSGGNEQLFYVDKTSPAVTENFIQFSSPETENCFNEEKTVTISVTEHHFDPNLMGLRIYEKEAGAEHSADGMTDVTDSMISIGQWVDEGDVHTLTFEVGSEAVYQIEMTPRDLAGNGSDYCSIVVFERDMTATVIEKRNGFYVSPDDTEFLDIYAYDRAEDLSPTLEFSDLNIEYLEYSLVVWKPDHSRSEAVLVMEPVNVYLNDDTMHEGIIRGGSFEVPDFTEDGVYALEVTAVDTAGNRSELNVNTYARMMEQDVLAFILNSNVERETGLYSFQYEDGTPISMRPDRFKDLEIFVMAKAGTDVDIVLRDLNADELQANAQVTTDDSIYGFTVYNYTLRSDFFRDSFDDDTDADLYLSAKNEGYRVDLGEMHIDSAAPTCEFPEELSSWHWYLGEDQRTVTITGISELLDEKATKIYDNGKEKSFEYSREEGTLTFTLEKGWHNIGVALSDTAGNINNIQERINIHVGYFWLWIILISCLLSASVITGAFLIHQYRKRIP